MLILTLGAVLLALGADRRPPSGTSDDRLYAIAADLRCLQCVGESVANSQAPIAIKMRSEIRRQTRQGATDDEIYTYFVGRYGQRVLLNPPSDGVAGFVWVVPVLLGTIALGGLTLAFRRWGRVLDASSIRGPDEADVALVDASRNARRQQGNGGVDDV